MAKETALVVNDDGIRSEGLSVMAELASEFWDAFVVAPREECSGVGKAISLGPIRVEETDLPRAVRAYAIDGTPADAVLLGIDQLLPDEPDIVLSGINLGPNLGIEDHLDSGTLGAAIEAAIHDIRAITASLAISKEAKLKGKYGFGQAKSILLSLLDAIHSDETLLSPGEIASVNIPYPDCLGIAPASVSSRAMRNIHQRLGDSFAMKPWELTLYGNGEAGSDIETVVVRKRTSVCVVSPRMVARHDAATRLSERMCGKRPGQRTRDR